MIIWLGQSQIDQTINALEWSIITTAKRVMSASKSVTSSRKSIKERVLGQRLFGRSSIIVPRPLEVHRVDALIHPDNIASIRLVERLGFRCKGGPLTDYWCIGDKFLSVMVYALVRGRR